MKEISAIKYCLKEYYIRVTEAKNNNNCYYVTLIPDISNPVNNRFAQHIIQVFSRSRKISHNHYLVDLNVINIDAIKDYSKYKDLHHKDLTKETEIKLDEITKDIVEFELPKVVFIGGDYVLNFDPKDEILVFDLDELYTHAIDTGFIDGDFTENWIKELIEPEISEHFQTFGSDRGTTEIKAMFKTVIKDTFIIDDRVKVLIHTDWVEL